MGGCWWGYDFKKGCINSSHWMKKQESGYKTRTTRPHFPRKISSKRWDRQRLDEEPGKQETWRPVLCIHYHLILKQLVLLIILKANGRLIIYGCWVWLFSFFFRVIGDVVSANPYEVSVLPWQINLSFPSRLFLHNVGAKQGQDFYFSPELGSQYVFVLRRNIFWLWGFFTYLCVLVSHAFSRTWAHVAQKLHPCRLGWNTLNCPSI